MKFEIIYEMIKSTSQDAVIDAKVNGVDARESVIKAIRKLGNDITREKYRDVVNDCYDVFNCNLIDTITYYLIVNVMNEFGELRKEELEEIMFVASCIEQRLSR